MLETRPRGCIAGTPPHGHCTQVRHPLLSTLSCPFAPRIYLMTTSSPSGRRPLPRRASSAGAVCSPPARTLARLLRIRLDGSIDGGTLNTCSLRVLVSPARTAVSLLASYARTLLWPVLGAPRRNMCCKLLFLMTASRLTSHRRVLSLFSLTPPVPWAVTPLVL